jgi:hypothetical protein
VHTPTHTRGQPELALRIEHMPVDRALFVDLPRLQCFSPIVGKQRLQALSRQFRLRSTVTIVQSTSALKAGNL